MSPSNWPSSSSGVATSDPPANQYDDDNLYGNKLGYRDEDAGSFDDDDVENFNGKDGIMNSSSSSMPKSRCCSTRCKCCLCFLFLMVVVIVTATTVSNYQQAKASYTHWRYASLDAPPQELPQWCSTKDDTSEDYNNCLLYCHPADCCTVPADYAEPGVSCLDPNNPYIDNICGDYRWACGHLNLHDDANN